MSELFSLSRINSDHEFPTEKQNMSQTFPKTYFIKKGAADPFRGDWYIEEKTLNDLTEAISTAADLTLMNFKEFGKDWEEFGYE
jgi:hypothetical protein